VAAVPFIDLTRLTSRLGPDVLEAWSDVLTHCEFVGGPRVSALEERLRAVLGAPHVIACANGTDALLLALQAAGVRRGHKVAIPNLTFWASFEAVAQLGAVPVLVDIDPGDLQLSLDELRSAHEAHRLDAVLLVHLYGWASARLVEIRELCKQIGVPLVEDAAQAFGVEVAGKPLLADAELSTLSFYPAKVVGGAMDGGAVTARTEAHAAMVRSLGNHGRSEHYSHAQVGWNSRMGGLQAAFLSRVLDELTPILDARRAAAAFYRTRLAGDARVRVYGPPPGVTENGYLSVLTVEGHEGRAVVDALAARGVGAARTYPETMDAQPPVKSGSVPALLHGDLSVSRAFCKKVVNLPLFFGIRDDEREAAAASLLAVI